MSSCIRKVGGKTGETVTLLDVIRKVGDRGPQITPTTFFVLMRRAATATITKKTVNHRKEKMRESRREDIRLQETLPRR